MQDPARRLVIDFPGWVNKVVKWDAIYATDASRMRLVIELSRQNVLQGTGGPFGAAIFEQATGRLVSIGMNSVVRAHNSTLHAEMLAIMFAQTRVASYSLHSGDVEHALVTSCDPCAMCLGAILWSGVRRVVTGAGRDDAAAINFDEGPVFPESYAYLESRGIAITRGVLRAEAAAVIDLYRAQGGPIYNA